MFASEGNLLAPAYALLGVCSLFFITRAALRSWQRKLNVAEDCMLFLAYLFFLAMTVLYIMAAPAIYDGQHNEVAKRPWSRSTSLFVRKVFFTNNLLFWCCLWAVKFQFMAMYRISTAYSRRLLLLWWSLVALCASTLIGAIISDFTSCHSWHALWSASGCSRTEEEQAQQASLYYSLAVDVLTDLLLIVFGIHLLQSWKAAVAKRIGIGLMSCLGFVGIVTALLRALLSHNTTNLPSSSWLALWSIIEAAIAVILGCCPGLYSAARTLPTSTRPPAIVGPIIHHRSGSRGYEKQTAKNGSFVSMEEIVSGASRGHSRITSINGEVVGVSRSQSRVAAAVVDGSKAKHTPIQLPSTFGHTRNLSGSMSSNFWAEVGSGFKKDTVTPQITPVVSKRSSKATLRYTPIQIPGSGGHEQDKTGSLSGAFWGDMGESERAELEVKAKQIRIGFQGTKQIQSSDLRL